MKPDGGPAFPQAMVIGPNGQMTSGWDGWGMGGMTLRDYFAAHAPAEIPTWFTHVELAKTFPPMPEVEELDETHHKIAGDWRRDGCFDLPEEIAWWGEKVVAHRTGKASWEDLNRRERYVQWRWAYADMMLAERGGA
jgi:hypothetical protein